MIIAIPQPIHGIVGGAPQIIGVLGSDSPVTPRTFFGKGAPSQTTLPAGNGKYNCANNGWIVAASLVAAGAAYSPGDVLTENSGGTGSQLQMTVDLVDANGGLIDWHYTRVGNYITYPNSPGPVSGGTGNGATFNFNIPAPDYYIDITTAASPVLYVCTVAGGNGSSTWAKISGGGSGGLFTIYDPNQSYSGGQMTYKTNGANIGLWGVVPGMNVAAGTNNIANLNLAQPLPPGTPWMLLTFGIQTLGACSTGGQVPVQVNASQAF